MKRLRTRIWGATVTLGAVTAIVAAALPAAAGAHTDTSARSATPAAGPIGGIVQSRIAPATPAGPASTINVLYHGGPVLRTNTVYAIYWQPAGTSVSAGYDTLLNQFFTDVATASGATDNVYSTTAEYYDTSGPIAYNSTFADSYVDTTNPIPKTCKAHYGASAIGCVTEQDEQQEILRVLDATGWTPGPGKIFFLFTPQNVGSCTDFDGQTFCAYDYYCAYHSTFDTTVAGNTTAVTWANHPYPTMQGFPSDICDSGEHPNGDIADATINVVSHEHKESITDPDVSTGWFASNGDETSDKCAWEFGDPLGSTADGHYNEQIAGGKYWLQMDWSNGLTGCVQRPPDPATLLISSFDPSKGSVGKTVTIYGTLLGQVTGVKFGDGSAAFTIVSPTQIDAVVPSDASSGPITITTVGDSAESDASFSVTASISHLSTLSGQVGDEVVIQGTSLADAAYVKFGAVYDDDFTIDNPGQITTHVPEGALTAPIVVGAGSGPLKTAVFKVRPTLDPLVVTSGAPGTTIAITGKTLAGTSKVAFGPPTSATAPLTVTSGRITVKVPVNAISGAITVTNPGGSTDSAQDFTVVSKVVSFSPASGVAGSSVTINGSGLAGATGATFNGTSTTSLVAGGTKVVVTVPPTATKGTLMLNVKGSGAFIVGAFKPVPRLTGPASAQAGDVVPLTGTNLLGATSLKLNGKVLPLTVDTATTAHTTLPASGNPATGTLTITTPSGTSAGFAFRIRPTITLISPLSGIVGSTVVITGKTLQNPSKVTFGSASATAKIVSSSPTKITVKVPSNAVDGSISVTTPGGTTASAATFTVTH